MKTVLICLALFTMVISCMKTADICAKHKSQCFIDKTNDTKIICADTSCKSSKLAYECGSDHCTLDEATCRSYQDMTYYIKSYYKSISSFRYQIIYNEFLRNIKMCQFNNVIWSKSEICLREKNCLQQQIIPMRSGNVNLVKRIDCPCPESFRYDCGNHYYCATNGQSCTGFNSFNQIKSNQKLFNIDVKNCGFHYQKITKKKVRALYSLAHFK